MPRLVRLLAAFLLLLGGVGALATSLPGPTLFDTSWQDRESLLRDVAPGSYGEALELDTATIYHLELTLDESLTSLHGRQEVYFTNTSGGQLEEVMFQLLPNVLGGRLSIGMLEVDGIPVAVEYLRAGSVLRVVAPEPLGLGESTVIALEFELLVPRGIERNYGIIAYREGVLSLAHAYPTLAVFDGERWDLDRPPAYGDLIFSESSFYLVKVVAPAELKVVTSGVQVSRDDEGSMVSTTFVAGPVRDFYLCASRDYQVETRIQGDITFHSYWLPGQREAAKLVLDDAVAAWQHFSERFGPYPYRELDFVPIDTSALGVEFPGIIALASRLYRPGGSGSLLEGVTAHEVAHQWFYGVVGSDQVSEPWLDEALAQYASLLYFGYRYGQPGYRGFRQSLLERWDRVDRAVVPIGQPTGVYTAREYGALVYGLGPLVLEDLAAELGSDVFAEFLRDYYQLFRFRTVTTEAFRSLAEEHCDCDLSAFFETWIVGRMPP
ncbi:MAG: M1 family metallopeptidase [Trueperaceae bacterium]|nr:MAG: M1 family metallopeptidase [Trueperaceae bacterium]